MKDDMIRETLRRAAQGEPSVGDPWSRFERHARRAALARGGVVTALAAGAAIALVLTLPGLNAGPEPFVAPGPSVGGGWNRYVDEVAGFELRYPPEWFKVYANPGLNAEFTPQGGRPGIGHGDGELAFETVAGFTMALTMGVDARTSGCERYAAEYGMIADAVNCSGIATRTEAEPLRKAGASVASRLSEVGGRSAERIDVTYPAEPNRPKGGFDEIGLRSWCANCRETALIVDWFEGWTLQIRIIAPSAELFDQSAETAFDVVDTFARATPPPATGVAGIVDTGVPMDERTRALVAFMDARIREESVDALITNEVSGADLGWLYAQETGPSVNDPRFDYVRYRIREAGPRREDATFYTVYLYIDDDDPESAALEDPEVDVEEGIEVGPGVNMSGERMDAVVLRVGGGGEG